MADEEDPVEHEIDVYLSKNLSENLYIFQYPLRPAGLPYEGGLHLNAKIKPTQQKVELELAINTESVNYAKSKGEQIALNVDGINAGTENALFTSDKMDKQVLTSSNSSLQDVSRYAVGVLKNGELHLTPIHGLLQMRPSFSYLNRAENRIREENPVEETQEEEEAKPVTVKFSGPESAESKARKLASYEYLQRKNERETWVPVKYHDTHEHRADQLRAKLMAGHTEEVTHMQATAADYLQKLIPKPESDEGKKPALPSNILSMSQLKTMTLSDQIKALLTSAKLIRFSQLLTLLPKDTNVTSILRSLQHVAVLVQGCWVVKSEVLYPKDSYSAHSGVPAEVLCRGRDYVMWRFTQSRFVVRKEITSLIKLPAEDVKDILEQMSRIKVNKGWEFNMDCDHDFIKRYPEVVQRQNMLWDAKSQQLNKMLKVQKDDKKPKGEMGSPPLDKPKRRRTTSTRSRTKSGDRSLSDMSDTEMESPPRHGKGRGRRKNSECAMDNEPEKSHNLGNDSDCVDMESPKSIFPNRAGDAPDTGAVKSESCDTDGAATFSQSEKTVAGDTNNSMDTEESPSVSEKTKKTIAETSAKQLPEKTFKGYQGRSAKNGPGTTVKKNIATDQNPSVEFKTELLNFVQEKLYSRYVLNMTELKRLVNLKLSQSEPGHILATGVSEKILEQTILQVGGVKINSQWQPKGRTEPVYCLAKTGDKFDPIRAIMMDMFQKAPRLKSTFLKKKLEEETGDLPEEADLKRILKDYCTTKGGLWYLKGTGQATDS